MTNLRCPCLIQWQPVFHAAAVSVALGVLIAALGSPIVGDACGGVRDMFALTCHQIPSRCFWLGDTPLPICARCLGMWLGQLLAASEGLRNGDRVRWRVSRGAALVAVCWISWIAGHYSLPLTGNVERLASGTLGGMGVYILTICGIRWVLRVRPSHSPGRRERKGNNTDYREGGEADRGRVA